MTVLAVETSPLDIAAANARRTLARSGQVDKRDHIALLGAHADLREALLTLLALVDAHNKTHEAVRAS